MAGKETFSTSLKENEQLLRQLVGQQRGAIFRRVPMPDPSGSECLLVFFEVEMDQIRLELLVIRPIIAGEVGPDGLPDRLPPSSQKMNSVVQAIEFMYRGKVLLLQDGKADVYALEVAEPPHRAIMPPETESGISGPRESLTEIHVMNLAILRRRYPGVDLRIEPHWVGTKAKLEIAMVYLKGRPTDRMLDEVRARLSQIVQDGMQDVTELTEAIADRSLSVFPTVLITERPDIISHYLSSGRIALLMDNSPRCLIVPAVFMDLFTSADDFYEWRPFVTFLRFLRFIAFNIAVPLPALYVSVTTYHLQALPTQLTLSLLAQREGAPLPPPVEAAIMTLMFEILREAGVRLPRAIGPTVSIVGGLVIGDAAIRSGLTSPAMVLVVSATAVATFSLPSTMLANAATYYRFFVLFLASTFGFFGLLLGYLVALGNVAGLTSLGVPYMAPTFPFQRKHISAAFGSKPRPPKGRGAAPEPGLTREAQDFQERRQ
ncbi:MAG TPA: spore germination protein [Symbiobacteriaceae bacterium]|nr:spore germination protein [Symbiobacteriaceae bacterium]